MYQVTASPHLGQAKVHNSEARFRVLAAGRRWGKTRLGVLECLEVAASGGRAWWVAPSYKMGEVGWRPLSRIAGQVGATLRQMDRRVSLPTGGEVTVRSADDPQSLRGEGLDFVVVDEAAFVKEAAWTEALRPALADRQGRALFISTPKGLNWFWRAWSQAQNGGPEWAAFRFPTSANPFIQAGEIEAARQSLPERIFRQEFLADFIDDAGGVFRRVSEAATARELGRGAPGGQYVIGVDWGKHSDFTVLVVIDLRAQEMVALDRFNQIDYQVQVSRLNALAQRFDPVQIVVERNSMGEPLVEQLQRDGLPVAAFTTTNASKTQAIDALALAFEQGALRILPDTDLISELQAFEMERLPSGLLRYSAPSGMHDDMVMALALAWHGVKTGGPIERMENPFYA